MCESRAQSLSLPFPPFWLAMGISTARNANMSPLELRRVQRQEAQALAAAAAVAAAVVHLELRNAPRGQQVLTFFRR